MPLNTKYLILLLLVIGVTQSQLLLGKHHKVKDVNPKDWPIHETVNNKVDLSPLIPDDCYFPASKWLTYTGYGLAGVNTISAFGYIFYGAQAANGDVTKLPNYPVMIWFNGGPGSSSQFGNFEELGPLLGYGHGTEQSDYTFVCNEHTWNRNYNMLFIDNPVGTGLSVA
jgi:hypothetical protein